MALVRNFEILSQHCDSCLNHFPMPSLRPFSRRGVLTTSLIMLNTKGKSQREVCEEIAPDTEVAREVCDVTKIIE